MGAPIRIRQLNVAEGMGLRSNRLCAKSSIIKHIRALVECHHSSPMASWIVRTIGAKK